MKLSSKILSDITVYMKYSKYLEDLQRRETWDELVTRNKSMHVKKFPELKDEIDDAYRFVYQRQVLPSMRSMQFAGKPIELSPNRIYNCAYAPVDNVAVFSEIMFLLLGGTGVGFSIQRHHVRKLPTVKKPNPKDTQRYLVSDSIEGWSDSIKALMKSYLNGGGDTLIFDFADIRPKGARLITSGGKAPGPQPLKECLVKMEGILMAKQDGERLSSVEVYDLVCHIADAVLAGGIRRAALIALFSANDNEMLAAKTKTQLELNPQRHRANNSAVLLRHKVTRKFFMSLWDRVQASNAGEPGIYFTNDKDWGTNPCAEIALRPFQFCNLCEVNVSDLESEEDYLERVQAAAFIGTLQASYTDFHYLRPIWKKTTKRDALIGVSMTGIASNVVLGYDMEAAAKLVKKTNRELAKRIGINSSARSTTVKPAGTTSLAMGTSSGIHDWHSEWILRILRVGKNEAIYKYLAEHIPGLIEDEYFSPETMAVIGIPIEAPDNASIRGGSPIQLLDRVKHVYQNWVAPGHSRGDNTHNVSATISIKDDEWEEVGKWMWKNRKYYNGLSALPYDNTAYKQMPFGEITKDKFEELSLLLNSIDLSKVNEAEDMTDLTGELACAGGACEIV